MTIGSGGITVANGSGGATLSTASVALGASQSWTNNSTSPLTVSANISGTGALALNGSGTVTLSGSGNYSGGTTLGASALLNVGNSALGTGPLAVNGGTLQAVAGGATLPNSINGAAIVLAGANNFTLNGSISGGALVINGPPTTTLTGNNSFTGGTTLYGGTLNLSGAAGTTTLPGNISMSGSSSLIWNAANQVAANANITANPGCIRTNSDANTLANVTINVPAGSAYVVGNGVTSVLSNLTITGTLSVTNGEHDFVNSGTNLTANTMILNGAIGRLGANTANSVVNVGSGGLSMTNAGMRMGTNGAAFVAQVNLAGNFTGSGTNSFILANNTGPRVLDLQNGVRTFNISDGTTTIPATLQNGGVIMTGGGQLVLSATNNSYAGGTTVNNGTLVASNGAIGSATGTGPVTLNGGVLASDPTLGGTISGNMSGGSGAQIAPGGIGAVGTLTIGGNLSLNNNATLDFNVDGNSNTADLLAVNGPLAVSGAANVAITAVGTPSVSPIVLATFPSNTLTSANFHATGLPSGYVLQVDPTNLELVASNVGSAPTWTGPNLGNWSALSNWTPQPQTAPNGQGAAAIVGADISSPQTITLDSNPTLGQLTFSSSLGGGYTLASGVLTMDNGTNNNGVAQILVASGSHGISASVVLNEALSIAPAAGTRLDISGNISEANPGVGRLSLDGPGTLLLSGTNSYTGGTSVNAGTLIVNTNTALANNTNLSVGAGGTFIYDPSVTSAPAAGGATAAASPAGVAAVPEPGTLALLLAGLVLGLGAAWRRRKAA